MAHILELFHSLLLASKSGHLPHWGSWTYFLLILLVVIEGPSATLLGAAAASAGLMKPPFVFLAATIGNLTADSLWYSVGYLGKAEWLIRLQRFGLRQHLIERLKRSMMKHATKILLIAKFTLSFMIPTLITAGLLKIPWRRWFPVLIFADTVWTGLLVSIGYYSIESVKSVQKSVEYVALFISIIILTVLILLGRRLIKQWNQPDAEPEPHSQQR